MSSGEYSDDHHTTTTTTVTPPPQFYFCHQCNRTITLPNPPSSAADLSCPRCTGGFLEEIDPPSHPPPPHFPLFSPVDFSSLLSGVDRPSPPPPSSAAVAVFDPLTFLHNYLLSMRSGGSQIQFVIQNSGGGGGGGGSVGVRFPAAASLGDYFIGPGLEQLIQHLAENDPNRYGTPPAAKSAVEALPAVEATAELLGSDSSQCAVCMDEFEVGATVKQMPCKHFFHDHCIVPWLELHNSCPVCRFELPTDDPDYDQRSRGGGADGSDQVAGSSNDGGGGGGSSSGDGDGTVGRRFQILLPWPFGVSEDGNSGGGETRQEDLD